jgi:hypothetical protein
MRVAAIYDIHANLPALEAVLADIRHTGVDQIVVGGDVLPGPMPRETLALLRQIGIPVQFIHGNGDREVIGARRGEPTPGVPEQFRGALRWNAAELDDEDEAWLAGWPSTLRLRTTELSDVLFCHATPQKRHRDLYDLELAAARIRATDYPQADEFAGRHVLQPPPEESVLQAFARSELKP